jgi:hypothetical protein
MTTEDENQSQPPPADHNALHVAGNADVVQAITVGAGASIQGNVIGQ